MTEHEQVIAELMYLKRDCLEGSATDDTLNKAIALIKSNEPMVPKKMGGWYRCGCCDNSLAPVERVRHKGFLDSPWPRYCDMCGKKVKWS